jgi:hypothetical protein
MRRKNGRAEKTTRRTRIIIIRNRRGLTKGERKRKT